MQSKWISCNWFQIARSEEIWYKKLLCGTVKKKNVYIGTPRLYWQTVYTLQITRTKKTCQKTTRFFHLSSSKSLFCFVKWLTVLTLTTEHKISFQTVLHVGSIIRELPLITDIPMQLLNTHACMHMHLVELKAIYCNFINWIANYPSDYTATLSPSH